MRFIPRVWVLLMLITALLCAEDEPLPPLTFTVAMYEFEVSDPVRRAAFKQRLGEMNHDLVADLLDGSATGWLIVSRTFLGKLTAENHFTVDQRLPSFTMTPGLPNLEPGRPIGLAAKITAIKSQADGYFSIQVSSEAAIAPGSANVGGQIIIPALNGHVEETEMNTGLMLKRGMTTVVGGTLTHPGEISRVVTVTLE
jgi:hypothetical protein